MYPRDCWIKYNSKYWKKCLIFTTGDRFHNMKNIHQYSLCTLGKSANVVSRIMTGLWNRGKEQQTFYRLTFKHSQVSPRTFKKKSMHNNFYQGQQGTRKEALKSLRTGPQTIWKSKIKMWTLHIRGVIATPNCYFNYIISLHTGY